jgi:hypothetical protein
MLFFLHLEKYTKKLMFCTLIFFRSDSANLGANHAKSEERSSEERTLKGPKGAKERERTMVKKRAKIEDRFLKKGASAHLW